jgi:hypothetical protein
MEWKKPLTLALTVLVAALVVAGAIELARTTLGAGGHVLAAGVALGFVVLVVVGTVALGAKNGRWISNPDAYW